MNKKFYYFWLYLSVGVLLLIRPLHAQDTPPPFVDVTTSAGINSPRQPGSEKVTGQAWGDYDQDGWLDLYVTDTNGPNTLYRNNGDGTFSLSDLKNQVALPDALSGGAVFADYNNDGWPDLYVMNWGTNVLYQNINGTSFIDITREAGVGDESNGKTASWGDYDQDGLLDLYLANWSCTPKCGRSFEGDKDRLFHNNGDNTFTDVTAALGSKTRGAGFVASFVDFDNDGDQDIYLINDEFINPIGNVLWRNDGAGCDLWCFTDVSEELGADTRVMGMGLATGDYDNDGDFDFYFSNAGPMTLLQNQGDGFVNMALDAGVEFGKSVGWGSVFFDYNNDGWSDLYLAIMDGVEGGTSINPLFENNGNGTFTNLAESSGAGNPGHSIGVAYADYDLDGWVDLVVGNFDEGYTLYRNQGAKLWTHNWLAFKLIGSGQVNRDAAGARVTVVDRNGRSQMQEVRIGSSLGSGDSLELHFGFGEDSPVLVEIRWPDGTLQQIETPPFNQRLQVTYGERFVRPTEPATALEIVGWITAVIVILGFVIVLGNAAIAAQK
jgi:enediyne biosynthesis protein E4